MHNNCMTKVRTAIQMYYFSAEIFSSEPTFNEVGKIMPFKTCFVCKQKYLWLLFIFFQSVLLKFALNFSPKLLKLLYAQTFIKFD